ncbi:MAG TPA: hypothetical protein VN872_04315 [Candidatus Acidoferrum sp.]|nr:hypothetical protein [Candidatus Acidoferrum sp.]
MGVKKWNQMLQQQQPLLPAGEQIPGTIFSTYNSVLPKTTLSSLVKNLNPWNWTAAAQIPLEAIFPFWNYFMEPQPLDDALFRVAEERA